MRIHAEYCHASRWWLLLGLLVFRNSFAFGQSPSSIAVMASPSTAIYGQPVIIRANVTTGATGKVTFYDGVTVLGIMTISSSQASLTTTLLPAGTRSLRAYYGGDSTYSASLSAIFPELVTAGSSLGFHRTAAHYAAGGSPLSVAVGDFNHDGKADLAVTNFSNLNVLLGNGDGTFQTAISYTTGTSPDSVVMADFNGDGATDLAVTNRDSGNISVFLGKGDGTFQTAVNYITGSGPGGVAAADFNGDGIVDLAVGNSYTNTLGLLLGNGDGTFRTPISFTVTSNPGYLGAGDFNGDGKTDLVIICSTGVYLLFGNGDGTFKPPSTLVSGYNYGYPAVADFNGDGISDIAVGATAGGGIFIFRGNGDGSFLSLTPYSASPVTGLVTGDFNGDGIIDLAFTDSTDSPNLRVLFGNGDCTFQAPVGYTVAQSLQGLAAGDFNGDGIVDLAIADYTGTATTGVGVMLGGAIIDLSVSMSHGGGFEMSQVGAVYMATVNNPGDVSSSGSVALTIAIPSGFTGTALSGSGWACTLGTLTCTRSDALAPGGSYPPITITVNLGPIVGINVTATATVSGGGDQNTSNNTATDTAFVRYLPGIGISASPNPAVQGQAITITAPISSGATGTIAFYDGSTFLGTAAIVGPQTSFSILTLPAGTHYLHAIYRGDATFGPVRSPATTETVTAIPGNGFQPAITYTVSGAASPGVADFNHDGKLDVAVLSGSGLSILLGNGDGTFRAASSYPIAGTSSPGCLVIGDFNGDGNPDVAVCDYNGIFVLAGNGDGSFQAAVRVFAAPGFYNSPLLVGDFNGDGKLDLAFLYSGGPAVLIGNGDGTFQPVMTSGSGAGNWGSLLAVDLNGDGRLDLVALNTSYNGFVGVFLGNGNGTFQAPVSYGDPSIIYADSFVAGDFNGDGVPDIAVIYWTSVTVLVGNGDGSLRFGSKSNLGGVPGSFATTGDFNGDGKLDIAFAAYASGGFYIVIGNGDGTFQPGSELLSTSSPATVVCGDFNRDGRLDIAAVASNTVNIFLTGQFNGLTISLTHTPRNIIGGTLGTYQIVVSNPEFIPTSGTVTVRMTLPTGLAATVINGGYGWSCTLSNLTCTRTDSLAGSNSFPPISVTVATTMVATTVNPQASVSNGAFVNTVTNPTNIVLPTTTTLSVLPSSSTLGQPVTLTASMNSAVSGVVEFFDAGNFIGSAAVVNSQAVLTTRMFAVGARAVKAAYSGDPTHGASASGIVPLTVSAAQASGLGVAAGYPTGTGPQGVVAADLNGDGKTDLVTANSLANTVSVLLGNGDGTFRVNVDYPAGSSPVAVTMGDFNNDGKLDLAVANHVSTTNTVSVLLGNGDGTFQTPLMYNGGNSPTSIAAGDVNNDGNTDLLLGTTYGAMLLLGNGDGTFSSGSSFGYGSGPAAFGDFNGDGKTDLALSSSGNLYVQLGNGDGTFLYQNYWPGSGSYGLAVGDLNGDGKADVVRADGSSLVYVCLGKGDGTSLSCTSYAGGSTPQTVLIADVNGDGKLDVVTTSYGGTVNIMLGNGDGSLQAPVAYTAGLQPGGVVAGDFNGDGRTDLAATIQTNKVAVFLGVLTPVLRVASSHNGSFAPGQVGAVYSITVSNAGPGSTSGTVTLTDTLPVGLTATALTGTGWSCTLATLTCVRSDSLAPSSSYPTLTLSVNVSMSAPATLSNSVAVSGGNGIGGSGTDFTVITATPPVLSIANTPTSSFTQGQAGAIYTLTVSNALGAGFTVGAVSVTETLPAGLTLVSMSGTGWACFSNVCTRSDMLAAGSSYFPITVSVNVSPLAAPQITNEATVSGGGALNATANNITAIVRRAPLLFLQSQQNNGMSKWFMGGSNNSSLLNAPWFATAAAGWKFVAAGDLNGDGIPDLVFQNAQTNQVSVWFMTGSDGLGIASAPIIRTAAPNWQIVAAADMNNDGVADLIFQNTTTNQISIWFMNPGGMSFSAAPIVATAGAGWKLVAAGDVNQDGVPDLLFQNQATGQISVWFMNPGGMSFFSAPVVASPAAGWSVVGISDFNGDGIPDYVFQNRLNGAVSVWYITGTQGATFSSAPVIATAAAGWYVLGVN